MELLTRMEWLTGLISNVRILLLWDFADSDTISTANWHIRGKLEDCFLDKDRQAVLSRLPTARFVGGVEGDWTFYDEDRKLLQGPEAADVLPLIGNAQSALKNLETSIPRLRNIQTFGWETRVQPMPSSLCRFLSQLESLRTLSLAQQGEFKCSSECAAI
jgi:hypothetical protein